MKNIDSGAYAAHWGLTDFYDDSRKKLQNALASGEDFTTDWGCKKEIHYCSLTRTGGTISIRATAHMDDLYESDDLIYDALWTACHVEDELPEDIIESIRDAAIDSFMDDYSEASAEIPASSSFEEICEVIDRLIGDAEKMNNEIFTGLCEIVKAHVEFMQTPEYKNMKGEKNED